MKIDFVEANSTDPDETPHYALFGVLFSYSHAISEVIYVIIATIKDKLIREFMLLI